MTEGVAGGGFPLTDGDVHEFNRACAVSPGVDAGLVGLLPAIVEQVAPGSGFEACCRQVEAAGVWASAEGVEEMGRFLTTVFPSCEKATRMPRGVSSTA